jgi:hypothetical protein
LVEEAKQRIGSERARSASKTMGKFARYQKRNSGFSPSTRTVRHLVAAAVAVAQGKERRTAHGSVCAVLMDGSKGKKEGEIE